MEESKYEYASEKVDYVDEKNAVDAIDLAEDNGLHNSVIEAVRLGRELCVILISRVYSNVNRPLTLLFA